MSEDPDEVLVERCREGDRAAFGALVKRYQRPVYNAAYRVLGREDDAAEVAQIVFMRVIERLDQYDDRFRFFSWIYRIAMNESLNLLRSRDREAPLADDDEAQASERTQPEWHAEQAEASRRIQRALLAMKGSDRAIVALRHFCDCSYGEIAEILEIEVKTVKSRLFEARQRLRETLADLRPVA